MTDDPTGVLKRSLANVTIGVASSIAGRKERMRDTFTGEWDQQVQVPISGKASSVWNYIDAPVTFDVPLMEAQAQRMVPFTNPHFTYGVEMSQDNGNLIIIQPHVQKWTVNEFGWTVGATIRFAVQAPAVTSDSITFHAVAHLSFQGFGTIAEQDEFGA